jgi:hypothetical protein
MNIPVFVICAINVHRCKGLYLSLLASTRTTNACETSWTVASALQRSTRGMQTARREPKLPEPRGHSTNCGHIICFLWACRPGPVEKVSCCGKSLQ